MGTEYDTIRSISGDATAAYLRIIHDARIPIQMMLFDMDDMEHLLLDDQTAMSQLFRLRLKELRQNVYRIQRLVGNVLDDGQARRGNLVLHADLVSVNDLMACLIDAIRTYAAQIGLAIAYEAPAEAIFAQIDRCKFERLVLNLLSNALKHEPLGGTVSVRLSRAGRQLQLAVEDNGPGVPEALRPKLFRRFQTARSDAQTGIGLGLSIVQDFALLHGGNVRYEDRAQGGARFVVTLPLCEPPNESFPEALPRCPVMAPIELSERPC